MRGRAGYIHGYAKDLGISDDEAVYPSFYLRHRVSSWGQFKNLTHRDKEAISRRINIRKVARRRSEVRFYGRLLSSNRLVRGRSQKSPTMRDEIDGIRSSTPPDIRVYTPPASPLSTLPMLGLPEQILKSIIDYTAAAFEAKVWVSAGESMHLGTQRQEYGLGEVIDNTTNALELYQENRNEQTEQMISKSHRNPERLVITQDEGITTRFVSCIYEYAGSRRLEHIMSIIQAISTTAIRVLGISHPIARIFALIHSHLGEVENSALLTALLTIWTGTIKTFENALCPLQQSTLFHRVHYISRVLPHRDFERGASMLYKLIRECGNACHSNR